MNTTLHLPINKTIKQQAEEAVLKNGFSSLQEAIRVFVAGLANGNYVVSFQNNSSVPSNTDMLELLTQLRNKDEGPTEDEFATWWNANKNNLS
jgi:hypothetical protein